MAFLVISTQESDQRLTQVQSDVSNNITNVKKMNGRRQHVVRQKLSGFYQQAKFIALGSHQRSKRIVSLNLRFFNDSCLTTEVMDWYLQKCLCLVCIIILLSSSS